MTDTTTRFEDRLELALLHEAAVKERLRLAGWDVCASGQGELSEQGRRCLQRNSTVLRWFPDLTACREPNEVLLIDAKAGFSKTPNHSIEKSALEAHADMQSLF